MRQKLECIMLVDDDEPTNFLSSMLIEDADYTKHIQVADSGEKALNYLAKSKESGYNNADYPWPDLIFLDINMPAMNGWEFLEKYKALEDKENKIVIIMLTTSLNPDDNIMACNIPVVSGFEIKPLTSQLLDKVMSKYFDSYTHKSNKQLLA